MAGGGATWRGAAAPLAKDAWVRGGGTLGQKKKKKISHMTPYVSTCKGVRVGTPDYVLHLFSYCENREPRPGVLPHMVAPGPDIEKRGDFPLNRARWPGNRNLERLYLRPAESNSHVSYCI